MADELEPVEQPAPAAEIIADLEDEAEELDELSAQLAVHSYESEERHEQILGEISECQATLNRLASFSESQNNQTSSESPAQAQILTQLAELKAEMTELKAKLQALLDSPSMNPIPQALPQPPLAEENAAVPQGPVENPSEQPAPAPKRKRPVL